MMFICMVLLVVLLLCCLAICSRRPRRYPPGPKWLPLVGNTPVMKKLSKELGGQHKAIEKLSKAFKTNVLGLKLGTEYVVAVSSYPLVKEVLSRYEFDGRPDNFFMRLRCMGKRKGITATDGEFWKIQRKFVVTHLRELGFGKQVMDRLLQEEMLNVFQVLEENANDGIEFHKIIPLSVINVLWAIVSGSRMTRNDQRLTRLLNIMKERSKVFDVAGGILNQLPWLRHLAPDKTGYNLIKRLNEDLNSFLMETIEEHRDTWKKGRKDDLIYSFLTEMNENDHTTTTFSVDQLVMVCLDLFIAGSVTTGNTLDFCFLTMILYPDVQKKVQAAIDAAFDPSEKICYRHRNRIPYVEAVLFEVQRFCNIAPIGGPRRVIEETELDGYIIPKDTTVIYSLYSSDSDADYWKDPEVFRPERFLDQDGNIVTHERFMPFSAGRRRCLGDILAKSCLLTFFCEMLRKYEISVFPGTKNPTGTPIPGMVANPERYVAKLTRRT